MKLRENGFLIRRTIINILDEEPIQIQSPFNSNFLLIYGLTGNKWNSDMATILLPIVASVTAQGRESLKSIQEGKVEERESEGERAPDPGDFEWEVWEGEDGREEVREQREGAASGTLEWATEREGDGESGCTRERLREEEEEEGGWVARASAAWERLRFFFFLIYF